jgi:polar amino acid transport system substrate-binding protein
MQHMIKSILFLTLLISSTAFADVKTLTFPQLIEGKFAEVGEAILEEAYRRIGIKVEFIYYPSERALIESNLGNIDGEMYRINDIDKTYTNLIKVPTSYLSAVHYVYSTDPDIKVNGYKSLKSKTIAFRRGLKVVEKNTVDFNRMQVSFPEQAFLMLENGRVDIVIEEELSSTSIIKENKLENIRRLSPAISEDKLFHYLNKKHKHLVPEIDRVLKAMLLDGTIEKLRN